MIIVFLNLEILGIIDDFVNNNILFLINITTGNKIEIYNDLSVTVILWVKCKYSKMNIKLTSGAFGREIKISKIFLF